MPLPMVHLAVADRLTFLIEETDQAAFFLGAISPDAVHMRIGYRREDKNASHLYPNGDKEQPWAGALAHTQTNLSKGTAFAVGYGIHLMTDALWGKTVYQSFRQAYRADESPRQDETMAYYNDTDKLDFELHQNLACTKPIWCLLENARAVGMAGLVSSEEVDAWRTRTLHWYDGGESQHQNPVRYLSYDDTLRVIDESVVLISRLLRE